MFSEPTFMIYPNQNFESITINNKGFRGIDFNQVPDENSLRIVILYKKRNDKFHTRKRK